KKSRRSRGRRPREAHAECCSLTQAARGVDAAIHRLHQMLDDRQAQAGPAQFPRAGLVHAIEALEDMWQVLLGDAYAVVLNLQANLTVLCPPADADAASGRSVFERVIDEVFEDLVNSFLVRP